MFPSGELRAYFKCMYLKQLSDAAIDAIVARAVACPSERSLCSIRYLGGQTARVDGDAMALGPRESQYMFSVDAIRADRANDERNRAWARRVWNELSSEHPIGRSYLNFAGLGEEGQMLVRNSYGARNYERLQALKARYDPGNMSGATRASCLRAAADGNLPARRGVPSRHARVLDRGEIHLQASGCAF